MSKEIGPRERQLREQREAAYEANQKRMREETKAEKKVQWSNSGDLTSWKPDPSTGSIKIEELEKRMAEAAKKTGKSRKAKK